MSLATDLERPDFYPVPLVEFDSFKAPVFATNVDAFVWFFSRDALYPWIDAAFDGVSRVNTFAAQVSSVRTDEGFYVAAMTSAECISTPGSFFWGAGVVAGYSTYGLWVRRFDGNNPLERRFLYGITFGFRKGGTRAYFNDIEYLDRVKSIPGIKRVKGSYYTGKSVNAGGNADLNNADGELDSLIKDKEIFGNPARTKLGGDNYNYESFEKTFTGYLRTVSDDSRDKLKAVLKQRDDKLEISLPPNRFDTSFYPYLSDSNAGKVIPLVYGSVRDLPCICLNEDEVTPTYYTFKIADMAHHASLEAITTAYVYDGDVRSAMTIAASSLTSGTFSVLAAAYTPGQEVTVDCEGYRNAAGVYIETALDQIKDLIVTYGRAQDSALFFNTTYWDSASALNLKAGFAINKATTIAKQIEEITKRATLAHFQTDDDGRYSCRIFDATAAPAGYIQDSDIIKVLSIEDSADEELVATLVVNYNQRLKSGDWDVVVNTAYAEDCDKLYETYNQPDPLETLISDATDAVNFAAAFQAQYGVPRTIVQVQTRLSFYNLRIGDTRQVELHRPKCQERGTWNAEVVGVEVNFNDMVCIITLRLFEEVIT